METKPTNNDTEFRFKGETGRFCRGITELISIKLRDKPVIKRGKFRCDDWWGMEIDIWRRDGGNNDTTKVFLVPFTTVKMVAELIEAADFDFDSALAFESSLTSVGIDAAESGTEPHLNLAYIKNAAGLE